LIILPSGCLAKGRVRIYIFDGRTLVGVPNYHFMEYTKVAEEDEFHMWNIYGNTLNKQ
jgi:hypothetical protein